MLDHELKIASEPVLVGVLVLAAVGGGPFAVTFLLQAVAGDHEVVAEGDEVVAVGSEGLFYALLPYFELVAVVLEGKEEGVAVCDGLLLDEVGADETADALACRRLYQEEQVLFVLEVGALAHRLDVEVGCPSPEEQMEDQPFFLAGGQFFEDELGEAAVLVRGDFEDGMEELDVPTGNVG